MKVTIVILSLFLFLSCGRNPMAPIRHDFYSGDLSGDFSLLLSTTDYYNIGDSAVVEVLVSIPTVLTVKDKRLRSVREKNPIIAIKYRENNSLLPDTGRQAVLFLGQGKTDVEVEISTNNNSFIMNISFFGVSGEAPEALKIGDFPRGPIRSSQGILEELAIFEKDLEIDSASWVETSIRRIFDGYWAVNRRYGVGAISENGVSDRMFQFINSNVDKSRYFEATKWACITIMYCAAATDSVDAFYLRYIIESPLLRYAEDNSYSLDLLKRKDYSEFSDFVSDIINNPDAYADKNDLIYFLEEGDEGYKEGSSERSTKRLIDIATKAL